MTELTAIRDLIQEDVNHRGLRTDPAANLVTACADDFAAACRSIADAAKTRPLASSPASSFRTPNPPCGETDGPLGAIFLARALVPLGMKSGLVDRCVLHARPGGRDRRGRLAQDGADCHSSAATDASSPKAYWEAVAERAGPLTHLIALERVGPSHTPDSLRSQPGSAAADVEAFSQAVTADHHDRCHTMRGRDITSYMSPAHLLFEPVPHGRPVLVTIGIGDGGNEIGMGKIPWRIIRDNIPGGAVVACRVPCDHLIVCGISNWGAYGLAAGVQLLRGKVDRRTCSTSDREREILEAMVQRGPLVDGVTGEQDGDRGWPVLRALHRAAAAHRFAV